MLVAPLDANTLGKVASGICDNLLVSDSAFFLPGPHSQFAELALEFFMVGWFAPWTPCPPPGLTCVPASGHMDGLSLYVFSEGIHLSPAP